MNSPSYIMEHINSAKMNTLLNNCIQNKQKNNSYNIPELYGNFYSLVCENELNKYIQKTNVKSDMSKIHIGNGVWKTKIDKDIYSKLVKDVSINLKNKIDETEIDIKKYFKKKLLEYFNNLYEIVDTYSDEIYEDETDLLKSLKDIVKNLKCVILDYTHDI